MTGFNQRSTPHNRPAPAFTLIELLVVVSIIAMLIAMMLPAMSRARETARRAVCAGNLHQQAVAFQDYASDSFTLIPLGYVNSSKQYNYVINDRTIGLITPLGTIYASGRLQVRENWVCPSRAATGVLDPIWPPGKDQTKNPVTSRSSYGLRTTRATGSSSTEASWGHGSTTATMVRFFMSLNRAKSSQALLSDDCNRYFSLNYNHRDGVNVAYFDGSVRYIPLAVFGQYLDPASKTCMPQPNDQSSLNNDAFRSVWDAFDTH